jgi:hypothetical protein
MPRCRPMRLSSPPVRSLRCSPLGTCDHHHPERHATRSKSASATCVRRSSGGGARRAGRRCQKSAWASPPVVAGGLAGGCLPLFEPVSALTHARAGGPAAA